MSDSKFEVSDITDVKLMKMKCTRCLDDEGEPNNVVALIYHGKDMIVRPHGTREDVIAVFCQGTDKCDGMAWAFPASPDDEIVRKHKLLPAIITNQ